MDRTSLLSLGIVAGIMTLAYYVGGSKEVRWADTTTPTKKPTYADCDCGIPTDAIGDPTCEECFVCQCNKAKCDAVSSYDSAYCVYCQIAADCKGCDCQCAMCNKYVPLKEGDHPQGNTGDRHLFWCNMCGENLCGGCYGDDDGRYCEYHVGKGRAEQDGYSRYTAESLADRMPFPPSVPSAGTGSPGQMCEVCNESDDLPYDSDYFKNCRRCGKTVCHECWDTDIESDDDYHEICMDCWNVLDNVTRYDAESFAAEVPDKYKEPFKVPVVKIYGENGAIVIGHGVREYLIQEIKYAYEAGDYGLAFLSAFSISGLQKKSTQELVDILDHYLKEQDNGGASLEYHDMDGWVGWQIPDFGRE